MNDVTVINTSVAAQRLGIAVNQGASVAARQTAIGAKVAWTFTTVFIRAAFSGKTAAGTYDSLDTSGNVVVLVAPCSVAEY
jgi:hypothetical protein